MQHGPNRPPSLRYRDPPAAIDWLCRGFGFERHLVVPGEGGTIAHACSGLTKAAAGRNVRTLYVIEMRSAIMVGKGLPRGRGRPAASPLRIKRFNLRASAAQHRIIRAAASASGKTLSEFILDSACRAADNVRLDETSFRLNPSQWRKFVAALDRPARAKPRLRALLSGLGPFDGS